MSTTKASEREKQLETDLQTASDLRDEYKAQLDTVTGERDEAVAQRTQATTELHAVTAERDELKAGHEAALNEVPLFDDPYAALGEEQFDTVLEIVLGEARDRGIATTEDEAQPTEEAATAAQEPSEEETIKDLLKRNGLKKCWMLPSGPCFSEQHAREYAGEEFDSLTVVSLDTNAGTN